MKINGISYWVKNEKCEMLNLDDGLKTLCIPAFMDKVNGEVIGLCGSVKKFIVEDGNPNYYVKNNCLLSKDGELVAGAADSVIPTDGSVKRIGNMAFLHKTDNSTFKDLTPHEKRLKYFDLDKKIYSRGMLHTMAAFGGKEWDVDESQIPAIIQKRHEEELSKLKALYGQKD